MIIYLVLLFFSVTNFAVDLSRLTPQELWRTEIRCNWNKTPIFQSDFWLNIVSDFPPYLQFGTATSAGQLEGMRTYQGFVENNWTIDEQFGESFRHMSGPIDFNAMDELVDLNKNMHANAYRISIAWEKIQPEGPESFDEKAMEEYIQLIKKLKNNGIEVWVCLFHFTMPAWFARMGGFEKQENCKYFVEFGTYLFKKLDGLVTYWASYNEPTAYVIEAYLTGNFPPHCNKKKRYLPFDVMPVNMLYFVPDLYRSGTVMKHMLDAHVDLYRQAKKSNQNNQFGIILLFHPLDPFNKESRVERKIADLGNQLQHDSILNFFKEGIFNWMGLVNHTNSCATHALDFIGVNYYRHNLIQCDFTGLKFKLHTAREYEDRAPDNGKGIYPEGLLRSIAKASELKLPMYITEIGLADKTDSLRDLFLRKHIWMIRQAIKMGYPIKGVFIWSLLDIGGWKPGYNSKYGLYEVLADNSKKLRTGSYGFTQEFLKSYHGNQKVQG